MILFLDTSYLFPYVGIDLYDDGKKKWNLVDLKKLMKLDCEILYCDLSLFEIYAKLLKLTIKGILNLNLDEIHSNLVLLSKSSRLTKVEFLPQILEQNILKKLRKIHPDTLDVIIFYLSVGFADYFLTMDDTLKNAISSSKICMEWINNQNSQFQILVNKKHFEKL